MKEKRGTSATRSAKSGKPRGRTDWARVRAMKEPEIRFTPDAPETSVEDWAEAVAHRGLPVPPRKEQIALRVDADVLEWYRAQGAGWQTRMNAVLKAFRDAMR